MVSLRIIPTVVARVHGALDTEVYVLLTKFVIENVISLT